MTGLLLVLASVTLLVSSTPSHSIPSNNYRTPAVCGQCMSAAYGCNAVDDGDYASCAGSDVYATCSNEILYDNRPCPAELVWDDANKRCDYHSTCNTPTACESCVDDCMGIEDGDYASCQGYDVFATCSNEILYDNRPCPGGLVWDDFQKRCDYQSTCPR